MKHALWLFFGFILTLGLLVTCSNPIGNSSKEAADFRPGVSATNFTGALLGATNAGLCLSFNGSVECFFTYFSTGDGSGAPKAVPVQAVGLQGGVTDLCSGASHTCALKDGGVYCWGRSLYGGIGNGKRNYFAMTPTLLSSLSSGVTRIACGDYHNCAVKDGTLHCWGYGTSRQLGDNSTSDQLSPIVATLAPSGITSLSLGGSHTCAIANEAIYCWGQSTEGTMGVGDTTTYSVAKTATGMSSGVTLIGAGSQFTCAVKSGTPYCWGRNTSGELGIGTVSTRATSPQAVQGLSGTITGLDLGFSHACVIIDGGLKCWGDNSVGQLGNGTTTDSSTPVAVTGFESGVTAITANSNTSCALKDGHAYCWGTFAFLGNRSTGRDPYPLTPMRVPTW